MKTTTTKNTQNEVSYIAWTEDDGSKFLILGGKLYKEKKDEIATSKRKLAKTR